MWVPLPEQLDIFGWSVRRCPSNNQRWILILVQIPAHHTENVVYITLFRLPSRFCSRLTKIPWPNQAVGTTILNSGGSWFFCFQGFLLNWHPMAGRYASCQVPPCMPSERGTFFFYIGAERVFDDAYASNDDDKVGNTDLTITCCRYCKRFISITRRFKVCVWQI